MKRIVVWFMSTLTAVVLLLSYKTSTGEAVSVASALHAVRSTPVAIAGAPPKSTISTNPASTSPASTNPTSASSAAASAASSSSASTSSASSAPASSSAEAGPAAASAAGSTSGATSGTFVGAAADTRYGPVQVQITVTDGVITDVQAIDYPMNDHRDQEINSQAIPALNAEALAAKSAKIDAISGATWTSGGYVTSLQSALDQAGL